MRSPLRLLLVGLVVAGLGLLASDYFLLWKPSQEGKCGGGFKLGSPETPPPRLSRFRGKVVGKSMRFLQYRWLRRQFIAVGATLDLTRELPSTEYKGNIVRNAERVGREVVIDKSGRFDFGELSPGRYELTLTLPGEGAVDFRFVIDPSASSSEVLIDASPAYYCFCCGWDFEPR